MREMVSLACSLDAAMERAERVRARLRALKGQGAPAATHAVSGAGGQVLELSANLCCVPQQAPTCPAHT